jgi:hypothetical protein
MKQNKKKQKKKKKKKKKNLNHLMLFGPGQYPETVIPEHVDTSLHVPLPCGVVQASKGGV